MAVVDVVKCFREWETYLPKVINTYLRLVSRALAFVFIFQMQTLFKKKKKKLDKCINEMFTV